MHQAWEFALDSAVPARLHTGRGSALLVHGWVFCRRSELASVDVVASGRANRMDAWGMPRIDVYVNRRRDGDEPSTVAYRCAFWGVVPLHEVREPQDLELRL